MKEYESKNTEERVRDTLQKMPHGSWASDDYGEDLFKVEHFN
jgi:hypothetical protein